MSESKFKTIRIKADTLEALVNLKRGRDTYDDVIKRLVKNYTVP